MKLVIAVVQDSDVDDILEALMDSGFSVTQVLSAGGFLREANVTLLIGAEDERVAEAIAAVDMHSNARRMFVNPLMPMAPVPDSDLYQNNSDSVRVGASVFVVNVRRFVRLSG